MAIVGFRLRDGRQEEGRLSPVVFRPAGLLVDLFCAVHYPYWAVAQCHSLFEIRAQEPSVRQADAKRKVIRSRVSEPLLPTRGQSRVAIVCRQQDNDSGNGSLRTQIVIGGPDAGQPQENVTIRTLHDYRLTLSVHLQPEQPMQDSHDHGKPARRIEEDSRIGCFSGSTTYAFRVSLAADKVLCRELN